MARRGDVRLMEPLFPRVDVHDTEKGGPRAPPRNKMALFEHLCIPSVKSNVVKPLNPCVATSETRNQVVHYEEHSHFPTHFSHMHKSSNEATHPSQSSGITKACAIPEGHDKIVSTVAGFPDTTKPEAAHDPCIKARHPYFMKEIPSYPTSVRGSSKSLVYRSGNDHVMISVTQRNGMRTYSNIDSVDSATKTDCTDSSTDRTEKPMINAQVHGANSTSKNSKDSSLGISNRKYEGGFCQVSENFHCPNHTRYNQCVSAPSSGKKARMIDTTESGTNAHSGESCFDSDLEFDTSCCGDTGDMPDVTAEDGDCIMSSISYSNANKGVSPDDVVGIIGQKHFWSARRTIINQQRVFVHQIFELHRVLKVQCLIAGSPHVLQSRLFLGNTSTLQQQHRLKKQTNPCSARSAFVKPPPPNPVPYFPTPDPPPSVTDPRPPCFPPPPLWNQWLVPVMSPSEGLVYKPYPAPQFSGSFPHWWGAHAPAHMHPNNVQSVTPVVPSHSPAETGFVSTVPMEIEPSTDKDATTKRVVLSPVRPEQNVIKVVPYGPSTAHKSAARIFQCIQEERQKKHLP